MHSTEQTQPAQDLQGGFALLVFLIFSVNRSVQVFSRIPGTTGLWFFAFFFWFGLGIQAYYYYANVQALARLDAIPEMWFVYTQIAWLQVHTLMRFVTWLRGYRLHSYEPGLGLLHRVLKRWDADWMGLASDVLVAGALGVACHAMDCPIHSGWYFAMIPWLIIGKIVISARDQLRLQRMQDTQIEASVWSQRLKERQHWEEIQRDRWGNRY
ncbi:MAG: hypothetical protein KDB03_22840 [Planctomycetales bacterium]|nr:hypothetical protein [Planctomycetales bacterium]